MKPRELAEKLIAALPQDAQISKVEIAGPGFLNFFQNSDALAQRLETALADAQLAVHKASAKQRVVIDLSSPNLARRCMSGICAPPSSAMRWAGCWSSSATR